MAISLSSIFVYVYFQAFFVFFFQFSNNLWWRKHKDCEMFDKNDEKRQQKGVITVNSFFLISPMVGLRRHYCTIGRNTRKMNPPNNNKKEENAMTCDRSHGEFVGMYKANLCVMQVLSWSMKNHNLIASLLVTLIVIHEFSWL